MSRVCNRCHQSIAESGDTWCVACSATEQLRIELGLRWGEPGPRAVGADILCSAVRQVRALRNLSVVLAGGNRASGSNSGAGDFRAPSVNRPGSTTPLPRTLCPGTQSKAAGLAPVKDERSEASSEEESSESEEAAKDKGESWAGVNRARSPVPRRRGGQEESRERRKSEETERREKRRKDSEKEKKGDHKRKEKKERGVKERQ